MINGKEITFLLEGFNPSGGLKIQTAIANTLVEAGIKVKFVVPNSSSKPFYPLHTEVEIITVGYKPTGGKLIFFWNLFLKVFTIKSTIVTSNFRISVLCSIARKIKPQLKPFIFLIQGSDDISLIRYSSSNTLIKWMNMQMFKLSRHVVANRVYVSKYLKENSISPGVMIPNFISEIFFDGIVKKNTSRDIVIGTVSTRAPNKGFELYLRCIEAIHLKYNTNDKKINFKCATQDLSLIHFTNANKVIFVSPKTEKEMHEFYLSCDILLSCSISEGFNLPVLEAMASGCVVIATDDGGVNDFIESGTNGYIIPERDPQLVLNIIDYLMKDQKQITKLQEAAKDTARLFNRVRFDKSYIDLFEDILSNHQ